MKRTFWIIVGAYCVFLVTIAAQPRVVISQFPPYPGDEIIQQDPSRFLSYPLQVDFADHQLVLVRSSEDDKIEISRFDLSNQTSPELSVQVSSEDPGRWVYHYTVSNGPSAKRSIDTWYLEIPPPSRSDPDSQSSEEVFPRDRSASAWNFVHYTFQPGRWAARWSHDSKSAGLSPGQGAEEYTIETDRKPGFVIAYFQNSVAPAQFPENLPNDLEELVRGALQDLHFNSTAAMTLGPKFRADAPPRAIAADLHVGISRMARHGLLAQDSPFVRQTLDYLQSVIDDPSLDESRLLPVYRGSRPADAREQRLSSALSLALQGKD